METIVVSQEIIDETQALLDARGGDGPHGSFIANAAISQALKDVFRQAPGWNTLSDHHKESLDLTATKISRILSGRPEYADHWDDIGGYARLGRTPR